MNSAISSATRIDDTRSTYVSSAPQSDTWVQLPASHYAFAQKDGVLYGQLIAGVYHQSPIPSESPYRLSPELAAEFEALERASDEALSDFESGL